MTTQGNLSTNKSKLPPILYRSPARYSDDPGGTAPCSDGLWWYSTLLLFRSANKHGWIFGPHDFCAAKPGLVHGRLLPVGGLFHAWVI